MRQTIKLLVVLVKVCVVVLFNIGHDAIDLFYPLLSDVTL